MDRNVVRRLAPTPAPLRLSGTALSTEKLLEEKLDGDHIVIAIELKESINSPPLPTFALVDCGATGHAFVDKQYASDHNLPLYKLKKPRNLEVIDGRPIESGAITHLTRMTMDINGHLEEVPMFVTQL